MTELFASLYESDRRGRQFGPEYQPPTRFVHGEWCEVAKIDKPSPDGDGANAIVSEIRFPASFFKVEVLPSTNSIGQQKPGWTLATGSGIEMGRLAFDIARAAAQGMISLEVPA